MNQETDRDDFPLPIAWQDGDSSREQTVVYPSKLFHGFDTEKSSQNITLFYLSLKSDYDCFSMFEAVGMDIMFVVNNWSRSMKLDWCRLTLISLCFSTCFDTTLLFKLSVILFPFID